METDERTNSIEPTGVMAMACTRWDPSTLRPASFRRPFPRSKLRETGPHTTGLRVSCYKEIPGGLVWLTLIP
jgi:hypothetical protein